MPDRPWDRVNFILRDGKPPEALASEHRNISLTAIVRDDHITLSWSLKLTNANWKQAEEIAETGAAVLHGVLADIADFEGEDT